jgi:hypothetical protein
VHRLSAFLPCLLLGGSLLVGCRSATDAKVAKAKIDTVKNTRHPGKEPLEKLFLRHCEGVSWRLYLDDERREIVECKGSRKEDNKEVIVRWHVLYEKTGGGSRSTAIPVYASVGGEEIRPPEDFRKVVFAEGKNE